MSCSTEAIVPSTQTPSHTLMDKGAEESPEMEQEEGVKKKRADMGSF